MTITYIDSGVLITIFRASDNLAMRAQEVVDNSDRKFASSCFVKLETISKAIYHKRQHEIAFYQAFFDSCQIWATNFESIVQLAKKLADKYGLNALDALQISSAISVDAEEFITTEKSTKPLHRVREVKVITIADY